MMFSMSGHTEIVQITARFYPKGMLVKLYDEKWLDAADGDIWIVDGALQAESWAVLSDPDWCGVGTTDFRADAIHLEISPLPFVGGQWSNSSDIAEDVAMNGVKDVFSGEIAEFVGIAERMLSDARLQNSSTDRVVFYVLYEYIWDCVEDYEYGKECEGESHYLGELDWSSLAVKINDPA